MRSGLDALSGLAPMIDNLRFSLYRIRHLVTRILLATGSWDFCLACLWERQKRDLANRQKSPATLGKDTVVSFEFERVSSVVFFHISVWVRYPEAASVCAWLVQLCSYIGSTRGLGIHGQSIIPHGPMPSRTAQMSG